VAIDGELSVSHAATFEQAIHASGTITSDIDVKAGDISLKNHPHGNVQPGSGLSGKPMP
jgi:hypothetical protein